MTRNVRWHEDRQERSARTADRAGRVARKLVEQSYELEREADRIARKAPKKAAALRERAFKMRQRGLRLADRATGTRASGYRYGRAKTRVDVYDRTTGWSDRDARRGTLARMPRRRSSRDTKAAKRYRVAPEVGGDQRQSAFFDSYADAQREAWSWLRRGRTPAVRIEVRAETPSSMRSATTYREMYRPMEWWTIGTSGKFKHHDTKPARSAERDWRGDSAGHSKVARGEHYTSGWFGRDATKPRRASTKAWQVWSRMFGEPHFIAAFQDKASAQRRIKRLQSSGQRYGSDYYLKHGPVPLRMQFDKRETRRGRRAQKAFSRASYNRHLRGGR